VFSLGYLVGLVPGPVIAVVGGLALITFGRALLLDGRGGRVAVLAFAVLAAALGVGALRWATLDLAELRGVQAVLGPTLTVGPERVALAASIAAGAALLALGSWSAPGPRLDRTDRIWISIESATGALAVVTVFFDPVRLLGEKAGARPLEWGLWVAAVGAATGAAAAVAWLLARTGWPSRWLVVGLSAVAVGAAAAVMVVSL
jgi:hypothetical protein